MVLSRPGWIRTAASEAIPPGVAVAKARAHMDLERVLAQVTRLIPASYRTVFSGA